MTNIEERGLLMKRYGLVSVCLFLLFILVAPWVVAQTVGKYDAVETVGPGTINWTSGEAFATGIGAPPSGALNPAQIRAMTERLCSGCSQSA